MVSDCERKNLFKGLTKIRNNLLAKRVMTPNGNFRTLYTAKVVKREYGKAIVLLSHNENLGVAYFPDLDFITPNMPKLKYAINFRVRGADVVPTGLNPDVMKHAGDTGYAFIKRDGFNLLFYELNGKVVPKTRLLPVAGKVTRTFVEKELGGEFRRNVENMIKDGFIPIFEVWGRKLDDYGIVHGATNPVLTAKFEGKKGDTFAELIAVRNNDACYYPYYPAKRLIKLAEEYGFQTPPLVKKLKIDDEEKVYREVLSLMEKFEEINNEHEEPIYEGAVLHVGSGVDYGMFKIKATTIMRKDVLLPIIGAEADIIKKVEYEVSKILLDFSPDQILFDDWPLVKQQLREYLAEDISDEEILEKAYRVALSHLVEKASEMIIDRYLDDYCVKIRDKFREYRKNGVKIDKLRRAMINKIMMNCREKGKI